MLGEESPERSQVRPQKRELTSRLLDAAVTVFSKRGFEAARVSEIARLSGLTTGAIYARWTGKHGLFVAAVEFAATKLMTVNVASSDMNTMEKFMVLNEDHLSSIGDEHRSLILEAYVLARRDEALNADISRTLDAGTQAYTALIETAKAEGYIDSELDTEAMLLCHEALYLGLELILSLETRRKHRPSAEQWRAVIIAYMSGAHKTKPRNRPHDD